MNKELLQIILAEDDAEDVELFETALAETCDSYNLTVAENGSQLIKLLNQVTLPSVIVLDLNMPLVSGRECLQNIRAQKSFDGVPIVILSTSNDQQDIAYCMAKGATKYQVKPSNFTALKQFTTNLCNGSFLR